MMARKYVLRVRWCNWAVYFFLVCAFLAFVSCWKPEYLPLFWFSVVLLVITVVTGYYVEVVE